MPQYPYQVEVFANANKSALEISAATVVKAAPGFVATISVLDPGSSDGGLYDASEASPLTGKGISVIPQVAGIYTINFPVSNGIVVVPGTGQVVSISFS